MSLSAETSTRLVDALRAEEGAVVERWVGAALEALRGRLTEGEVTRRIHELHADLLALLASNETTDLEAPAGSPLCGTLAELSRDWARQGFTPTETATCVFAAKEGILAVFGARGATATEIMEVHRFVDQLGLFTFETYVKAREELIADQAGQLLELATPVVKLWEGVLAVPLVGTLDSARAQIVTEKLLQALLETGAPHAILDITGVPAVDTQVAQHLLKTVLAARLMGAECIVSGIRPQIAQTVVALGIDFGDIVTKTTLADALVYALRASGVEMRPPARGGG